jgi:hypothetical protein
MNPLTETEKMCLALNSEHARGARGVQTLIRDVEKRLDLPSGAIGKTHYLDPHSGTVVMKPPTPIQPQSNGHEDRTVPPPRFDPPEHASHGDV